MMAFRHNITSAHHDGPDRRVRTSLAEAFGRLVESSAHEPLVIGLWHRHPYDDETHAAIVDRPFKQGPASYLHNHL
jgi:hypothetical protein